MFFLFIEEIITITVEKRFIESQLSSLEIKTDDFGVLLRSQKEEFSQIIRENKDGNSKISSLEIMNEGFNAKLENQNIKLQKMVDETDVLLGKVISIEGCIKDMAEDINNLKRKFSFLS